MAYEFKKLDKPTAGAGAPNTGSRFAYLAAVKDLVSFPDTDANNVILAGQPVFKEGKGLVPVYITTSSREYSYESTGDQDARSHKVKFMGSHPGTEIEALEFAQNNLDEEFIIFIPGCQSTDPVKVLGRPCAPLIFRSNHKSSKDGSKFEFTFEQETGSKYIYMVYNGPLVTAFSVYATVDFSAPLTALSSIQKVANMEYAETLSITSLVELAVPQVTFIGQSTDATAAGTIVENLTAPIPILLKNGTPWKAVDGSIINFEVYQTGVTVALVERWRT